jgi:hypothetical protein
MEATDRASPLVWLAFLMWMGLHRTANEEELWSSHWMWERPTVKHFFSWEEHLRIKAALHLQHYGEENNLLAIDGKPMLKKVGILMDHMRNK